MAGTRDVHSTLVNCICATNTDCKSPSAFYNITPNSNEDCDYSLNYILQGLVAGCSPIDSLLLSTLECFYSDTDCPTILSKYLLADFPPDFQNLLFFEVYPLVYDSTLSRFPPNTSIGLIVQDMMIERWNLSTSYNRFYELCAPTYCTYSQNIRTKTLIGVIIRLLSMVGGLTVSLRLITPRFVRFIFRLLKWITEKKRHQQEQQGNHESNVSIKTID